MARTFSGRRVQLGWLGPGNFFGELSLLDRRERMVAAVAIEATRAVEIELDLPAPERPGRLYSWLTASPLS